MKKPYLYSASCILAGLVLSIATAGCASSEGTVQQTETSAQTTETAVQTEADPTGYLPEADYNGYEYRILGADVDIPMVLSDTLDGNIINDAVYNANRAVEERYNIKLMQVPLSKWDDSAAIRSSILSGEDAFDLGVCHDITAGNLSLEGLFVDLHSLPHLDFSQPWWPEFTTEGLTINGKMYIFSNFIGYNGLRGTKNMYVNLDRLADYDLPSPYDMVKDGTWTLDKVISMTKDIYEDVNGDQVRDRDDFFGFAFTGLFYGWLENFGIEAYVPTADGTALELAVNTPRTAELTDTVKSWLVTSDYLGVWYQKSHPSLYDKAAYSVMFADGNCLFTYGSLYVLIDCLTNSDVKYGILPMPKMDEQQEDYYGVCYDSPMFMPITVSDPDRTAVILEAMSAEGYKTIMPAYKEVTLKDRYATDVESSEMLDIIFSNRVLSRSYIYGRGSGLQMLLNNVVPSETLEFASFYEKNESAELKQLEKINEFFKDAD